MFEIEYLPEAVVALIFQEKLSVEDITLDTKILGISRKHDPNDFGLPGGKVDPGETRRQ